MLKKSYKDAMKNEWLILVCISGRMYDGNLLEISACVPLRCNSLCICNKLINPDFVPPTMKP